VGSLELAKVAAETVGAVDICLGTVGLTVSERKLRTSHRRRRRGTLQCVEWGLLPYVSHSN